MTKQETIQVLQSIEGRAVDFPYMTACDWVAIAAAKRHLENSLEVKEADLEKEWKEYFKYRGDVATINIKHLAKHFFELGMRFSAIGSDYIEGVRGYYETTTK